MTIAPTGPARPLLSGRPRVREREVAKCVLPIVSLMARGFTETKGSPASRPALDSRLGRGAG